MNFPSFEDNSSTSNNNNNNNNLNNFKNTNYDGINPWEGDQAEIQIMDNHLS
jgi:hypothetical protein